MATTTTGNLSSAMVIHECTEFPPNVHSGGILHYENNGQPFTLPILELQIILIFITTQSFHFVFRYFGIPKLTSQLLAGLMFSTSLLGAFDPVKKYLFNISTQQTLGLFAEFGYALFIFMIGAKMDLGMILRTGQKALCTGVACVAVPVVVIMLLQMKLTQSLFPLTTNQKFNLPFSTLTHCMTPFPVVALLIEEMGILNSELGRLSLSAALVSDIFSLLLQFFSTLARIAREDNFKLSMIGLGSSTTHIVFVAAVLRPAMCWVVKQTPENRPVKKGYINTIIILVLASGVLSHYYGLAFFFGPFIFGLAVPAGPPLGSALEEKLNLFVSDVILPIFVTTCAMRTDFWSIRTQFATDHSAQVNLILLFVALGFKFLASIIVPLYCRMPFNDALALALILCCRGIIHISIYTDMRDSQTMTEPTFALVMISIVLSATLVPMAVKLLYDPSRKYAGYMRRNIMHLKPSAELKILACIHRSANMPAVINLLDAACPTKENPIGVYVLHLIQLVGRSSPVFISHQMQTKSVSNTSYSDTVILYFNHFLRENLGALSLNIFTAISHPKYMNDDICTLALDKLVSMILLPFHRKWAVDGSIESEDNAVRALNCNVMDRAPCSVGILVDRGHLGQSSSSNNAASGSSFSVAIIFLGGSDDREALAFAKRMAHESTISLTLIRLVASDQEEVKVSYDRILDEEELKDFRYNHMGEGYVIYLEEVVNDGPQTTTVLQNLAGEYDLIIVGRRYKVQCPQTSGLSEWTEFPELGIVGDLLASPDHINSKASVLVMQQQKMMT